MSIQLLTKGWKMNWLRCAMVLGGAVMIGCGTDPETAKLEAVRSGDAYVAAKKLPEAIVEYRRAVQIDPRFGEARLKLADAFANSGNRAAAYREYIRAADLLPGNVQAQLKAAGILIAAQQFEDAQSRAEGVLAGHPDNVDAQILRATALAGLKKIDLAVAEVEELLRNPQEDGRTYTVLGQLQALRGNDEAAETAFLKAIELDGRSLPARLGLTNFYWAEGRRAEAEAQLKAALDIDPKNELVNRSYASFLLMSGRSDEAERYLKTSAQLTPDGRGTLVLADYYTSRRRVDEARALLEPIAKSGSPSFAAAKLRLSAIEAGRGNAVVALRLVDEIVAAQPANADALAQKARLLAAANKLDEALNSARAATQADSGSASAQFTLARIHRGRGETADAIAALQRAVQLNSQLVAAEIELGELQLNAGRVEEAEQRARSAVSKAPDAAEAQFLLARVNLRKGNVAEAERALSLLAKQQPGSPEIQTELGRLQVAKKNLPAARAAFERVLENNPTQVDALSELTRIDLQSDRTDVVRARLERAMKQSPRSGAVLLLAASTYAAMRDDRSTETALRKLIEVEPQRAEGYTLLGQLYLRQGKKDLALQQYQVLVARQPKLVAAHMAIGSILQQQNRRVEAKEAYRKAVSLDANAIFSANNLAFMYAEDNERLDEALQLAQAARARMPETPEIADTLGFVYYKKGLFGSAAASFKEAVEKRPDTPAYRYHLGLAYARNGDNTLARQTLEAALKLDPNAREATEARGVLAQLIAIGL